MQLNRKRVSEPISHSSSRWFDSGRGLFHQHSCKNRYLAPPTAKERNRSHLCYWPHRSLTSPEVKENMSTNTVASIISQWQETWLLFFFHTLKYNCTLEFLKHMSSTLHSSPTWVFMGKLEACMDNTVVCWDLLLN